MKLLTATVYLVQKEKEKSLKVDSTKKITLGVTIPTLAFQMEGQNYCPHTHFVDFLLQYVGIHSQPEALHSILWQYAGNPGQHACKSWQHARNSWQCATNSWQCATNSWQCATDSCQSTSHPWPYASNTCIQWLAYASIWQNGKYHTSLVNQQHICILSMLNDKYTKEKTDLHFN